MTSTKRNPTCTPNKSIKSNHWSDPKIKDKNNKDDKFKSNIRGLSPIEGHKRGDGGIESVVRALVHLREDEQRTIRKGIGEADDKGVAVLEGNIHDLLPILEQEHGLVRCGKGVHRLPTVPVRLLCGVVDEPRLGHPLPRNSLRLRGGDPGKSVPKAHYIPIKLGLRLPVKGKDRLPVLLGKGGEGDKEPRREDKGIGGAEDEGRVLRKLRSREVLLYKLIAYPQFSSIIRGKPKSNYELICTRSFLKIEPLQNFSVIRALMVTAIIPHVQ
ncbi:hypothetical protein GcM1_179012 [Golovinomyces cichoracearum]|uniref:Uncharacterized protein n=1 Tax=Golovinomyces cichoracearum TaxID=62708 RepID=A0A420J4N0_9PEZI|nr:hypothetical protein GcM1_179012 [Golovinomyces cichoracearum]